MGFLSFIPSDRRTRFASAVAALSLATLLVGSTADSSGAQSVEYVAMGDSFSSGTGAPTYDLSSGNCRRAPTAYPRLIEPRLGFATTHAACHGATTTSLGPQFNSLSQNTDVVTITIGGNDIRFADVFRDCVTNFRCGEHRNHLPGRLLVLRQQLKDSYVQIRGRAREAQILVIGYPSLVSSASRRGITGLSQWEISWLIEQAGKLDAVINSVVQERQVAGDEGIHYLSVLNLFAGREACTPDEYVHCLRNLATSREESFHPNVAGHEALATAVQEKLSALSSAGGGATSTATSLVIDVSDSMTEIFQGERKIDAAIRAAQDVITLLRNQNTATSVTNEIAIVTFSDAAYADLPLTLDLDAASTQLDQIHTLDATNIGAGLDFGLAELQSSASTHRNIILLSDGEANVGLLGSDLLAGPVTAAEAAGVKIFTIGFGEAGQFDEPLLQEIALRTGGEYSYAATPFGLRASFARAQLSSTGRIVGDFNGSVTQGQDVTAGRISVPEAVAQLQSVLAWPGSDLDLIVEDPEGEPVVQGYPGATLFMDANPAHIIVKNPEPGEWTLRVRGVQTDGPEEFVAVASTSGRRTVAQGGPIGLIPILVSGLVLLIGLGGGATFLVVKGARRKCPVCGASARSAWRICARCRYPFRGGLSATVLTGPDRNRRLVIKHDDVIGHEPTTSHQLSDPTVSGAHAQVVWTEGQWLIQDLGSSAGLLRNGESVIQARIRPGDKITLGRTEILIEDDTG